ncbi:MAG: FAD-dependent oxidoreductase [Bacteroidota bacterium]
MISIWEQQSFLTSDVAIIGAGITGLSCAASIKERNPRLKVVVLEKGILPSGASTKNAGFACFGSLSELIEDQQELGAQRMVELVHKRQLGLKKTIQRLGKDVIDLQLKSGFELVFQDEVQDEQIEAVNALLLPIFQTPVFHLADKRITTFGFRKTNHLIENKLEGQLDTGKLMSSLWNYCSQLGVQLFTGCEISDFFEEAEHVNLRSHSLSFRTKKLAVCTNAFARTLVPDLEDVNPGRGMVLMVDSDRPLPFEGTFHYEKGFYYFRDYYGRLIFGGGRNLDFKQEETLEFGINQKVKEKLISDLREIILPDHELKIVMEWSGIMAFGKTKEPIIQKVSDNVVVGVKLGGMGVAIGSLVGDEIAQLLLST